MNAWLLLTAICLFTICSADHERDVRQPLRVRRWATDTAQDTPPKTRNNKMAAEKKRKLAVRSGAEKKNKAVPANGEGLRERGALGDAVKKVTAEKGGVKGAVGKAVGGAVGGAVGRGVGNAVGGGIGKAIGGPVGKNVGSKAGKAIGGMVGRGVGKKVVDKGMKKIAAKKAARGKGSEKAAPAAGGGGKTAAAEGAASVNKNVLVQNVKSRWQS